MQDQYFNTFQQQQQTYNMNRSHTEELPPFGRVNFQSPVVRPNLNQPLPISSPQKMPMSPPQPELSMKMVVQQQQHPISLSPLSCGGFIYTYLPSPQSPPQPPPMFIPPQMSSGPQFQTNAPQFVSSEIAARHEKLEKYRDKRARRNFNRPVSQGKRERACARARDPHGHFVSESKREQEKMRQALEASQKESFMLKNKLSNIEQELELLRKKAEEASASKLQIQHMLEAQQRMNQDLLRENNLLWSTVPQDEVFNTVRQNPPVFLGAFKEKIDLSAIELNWTDSPHLEAARSEDADLEQRWDDINFFAGVRS